MTDVPCENIELDDELSTLGIDSLQLVELIITLEDEFAVKFDDSDLDPSNIRSVASIIELIKKTVSLGECFS